MQVGIVFRLSAPRAGGITIGRPGVRHRIVHDHPAQPFGSRVKG